MQTTTSSTLSKRVAAENNIKHHLFIGGCSRSGTTLLGAMLGSHPDLICTPESHFKTELLRQLWPHVHQLNTTDLLAQLTKHWRFKLWEVDESPRALARWAKGRSYGDVLDAISFAYARKRGKPGATTWVDHTPENISYTQSLLALYPNARFVHIVRDGRAVASSILPLDWGPNSIIKAARWWMRMTSFGLAAEASLNNQQIIRVKYEELITSPEPTIRRLCQFMGVAFQPAMLDANGFTPPRYTTRQHQLVGRKPNASMRSRWRDRLTPRQIEIFEHQTRDFLENLGYTPEYGLSARAPTFAEIQLGKATELLRGELTNKIKWLIRSYPLWLTRDFYTFAQLTDANN